MPYRLLEDIIDIYNGENSLYADTILYNAQKTTDSPGYLLLSKKEDGDYPFYTIPISKLQEI